MKRQFSLLLPLLLCLMGAGALADEPGVRLLGTGQFHGAEVSAEDGETWLALTSDEYGFLLKAVTLRVETVYDPVVDVDPGAPTGKRVSVSGVPLPEGQSCKVLGNARQSLRLDSQQPIALIQGIEPPRTGRLTQGSAPNTFLYPGQTLELSVGPRYYSLMAYGEAREDNILHNYRLLAWQDEASLPLVQFPELHLFEAAKPQVLWAGDLNGDGKLDLLLERSDHYNVSEQVLFLSGEEPWLKEAATFRITGC